MQARSTVPHGDASPGPASTETRPFMTSHGLHWPWSIGPFAGHSADRISASTALVYWAQI